MLESEKQQRRFQDKSSKELILEYERHFVNRPEEKKPLPNSPYPEEGTGDLFKKKNKKGS
ncbi:MAG TPA: hypothetical protein VNY07_13830 [Chthoniobacterales bacterium]|jgi:hypothetical protein|nr:hypothetical protein [Chthoniobacterales bacterium]